ncbi:MAG: hypothetical protein HFI91_15065 [Lachnospiraceae bacterium]|jgi:prolyl-tRNA editing enzyme YbaK/EbsC (Cys-tRNA(Pro) deacylase)|nr:hypothetical protein [Lachnospiraceae bacterium]
MAEGIKLVNCKIDESIFDRQSVSIESGLEQLVLRISVVRFIKIKEIAATSKIVEVIVCLYDANKK